MRVFYVIATMMMLGTISFAQSVSSGCSRIADDRLCALATYDEKHVQNATSAVERAVYLGYWRIHLESLSHRGMDTRKELARLTHWYRKMNKALHKGHLVSPDDNATIALGKEKGRTYRYYVDTQGFVDVSSKQTNSRGDECVVVTDEADKRIGCLRAKEKVRIVGIADKKYLIRFEKGFGYIPRRHVISIISTKGVENEK